MLRSQGALERLKRVRVFGVYSLYDEVHKDLVYRSGFCVMDVLVIEDKAQTAEIRSRALDARYGRCHGFWRIRGCYDVRVYYNGSFVIAGGRGAPVAIPKSLRLSNLNEHSQQRPDRLPEEGEVRGTA